jgi:hypothetical protein
MISTRIVSSVAGGNEREISRAKDASRQSRREKVWAWLTLFALVLCWDASIRLDERVSPPRVRIAHIGEAAEVESVSTKRR